MRQVDGVLHDIDLVIEGRRDVHRGIRDDQRIRVVRHVHDEAVADPAGGPNAGLSRHHGSHQFVGVQAALHQRLDTPGSHQLHRLRRGVVAVVRFDDLHCGRYRNRRVRRRSRMRSAGPTRIGSISRSRAASTAPSSDTSSQGCATATLIGGLGLRRLDQALVLVVRNRLGPLPRCQAWAASALTALSARDAEQCLDLRQSALAFVRHAATRGENPMQDVERRLARRRIRAQQRRQAFDARAPRRGRQAGTVPATSP